MIKETTNELGDVSTDTTLSRLARPSSPGSSSLSKMSEPNALVDLITRWNSDQIEVGMVRLLPDPIQTPFGVQVGTVEADPLIVSADGEVVGRELGAENHIIWHVAADASKCLDALLAAAKSFTVLGPIDESTEMQALAKKAAAECAALAGGQKYKNFYEMLLGYFG